MVASFLYGTLYMVYADAGGHFSWEAMKVSPVMMYHQVLPRLTWPQLDGVVISANCTVVAIFGAFLAKRAGFTAGRYWVVNFERRRGEENRKDHRDKRVEVYINTTSKTGAGGGTIFATRINLTLRNIVTVELPASVSGSVVKNHALANRLLSFSLTFTFLLAMTFFYVHIFFISPINYKFLLNNVFMWFVALPLNIFYMNYGNFVFILFYFIFN